MIRLLCWEGYDSPRVLNPFERRSATRVDARTLLSDAGTAEDLLRGRATCDVLNINNAWIRGSLHPGGLVRPLDPERFEPYFERMLPQYSRLYAWARDGTGSPIGICQRFGPFNLVVNTNRIDRASAEDQGFELANERSPRPYGILLYEDFNLFHVCIGAGLDPFSSLGEDGKGRFDATARRWFHGATVVTDDHFELNRALVDGTIDFYVSGGIYTASPARLAGHPEVRAVTPRSGPIGGRGGIVFTEITSVLETAPGHGGGRGLPRVSPGTGDRPAGGPFRAHRQPGRPDGDAGSVRTLHCARARCNPVGRAGGRHCPLRRLRPDAGPRGSAASPAHRGRIDGGTRRSESSSKGGSSNAHEAPHRPLPRRGPDCPVHSRARRAVNAQSRHLG